jgi:hypothetical protein
MNIGKWLNSVAKLKEPDANDDQSETLVNEDRIPKPSINTPESSELVTILLAMETQKSQFC